MPFLNDLVTQLEADALGTYGTDIFVSSKATVPKIAAGSIHLADTGGTAPVLTHNDLLSPAYVQPSAQVTIRHNTYEGAMTKAVAVRNSLSKIRNQLLNATWYLWVKPQQEPIDLGIDDTGQTRFAFNVLARKRP